MLECVGGRAGRARLRIPGMMVVVVVAPLKPCILYKRERELDRQTIPLQGVGEWSMWDQPLIIGEYGSGKATLAMKAALAGRPH